uniref:uncharacterized protein LOC120333295 isoform X2 n=1 Tax=Styela clava TaxID=7725 RepID=UPI0019396944|nr:uncharacterized protein LOC120333295 isoform X2 [Styela clava]
MESRTDGMNRSEKLTSASDDLRKTETACDFMIKVGEETFPVHQDVLIAASGYFRAMLSHDTKERQEGVVDMKEVEPDAVKLCIEFIYKRATTVTMETVEILLPAAGILQLNALSENCVEFLEKNLKAENCISVLKLARTHSFADLEEKALELFRENFEEFGDFAELEKEGSSIYYLHKNGEFWIEGNDDFVHPKPTAQIVTNDQFIYVIENDKISYCDGVEKYSCNSPSVTPSYCDSSFFAAVTNQHICLLSSTNGSDFFDIAKDEFCGEIFGPQKLTENSCVVSYHGDFYAVTLNTEEGSSFVKIFCFFIQDWEVKEIGTYSGGVGLMSYCESIYGLGECEWKLVKEFQVQMDSKLFSFSTSEKLFILAGGMLYSYDDDSDSIQTIIEMPNFSNSNFPLGQGESLKPHSVCAFKGNLDSLPEIVFD